MLVAGAAMLAIGVPAASAAPGTLTFQQSFATFQMDNASDTVVSPDGKHVYMTAFSAGDGSVTAASRDASTGQMTFIEEYLEVDADVEGIEGAEAIAISPDGDHVYVAGSVSNSVAVFERNETTGTLNFIDAYFDGDPGILTLGGATDVAVSGDGNTVYVAAFADDALMVFSRNAGTGALAVIDAEIDELLGVDGLNEVHGVAVAPDDENVYTVGQQDSDVTTFTRQAGTGALAFLETDTNGDATLGAFELAVSPDNANVYVIARASDAVSEWDRAANGALAFGALVKDGVETPDLNDPRGIGVSPDGGQVYATSAADDALLTLDRAAGGALTVREAAKDGQNGVNGLNGADGVGIAPNGTSVYVAGGDDDRFAVFSRELPPAPPADPPANPPASGLTLELSAKKKQKAGKLAVTATCSVACDASAKAKGKAGGEKIKSKRASDDLGAGEATKLRLKLGRKALAAAKGERGKLTVTVTAGAGNDEVTEKLKIKLTA